MIVNRLLLALLLGISALTAATAVGPEPAEASAPRCTIERLPDDLDTGVDARGVPRYLAWSRTPANQQALDAVHRALDTVFGPSEAAAGLGRLDQGLIGLVLDHREQRFVIVLSRHLDLGAYRQRMERLVPPAPERGAAPVVVQHGCTSSRVLAASMRRATRGSAPAGRFSARVDPASSRVQVTVPPNAAAPALSGLPAVAITHGDVRSRKGARTADRSPHWGAASISRPNGITCTSWATVKRPNGRRMGVTAGHCGGNGATWRSGDYFYGVARARSDYPEQDSVRLHGRKRHGWRPRIHVNRGSRVVAGAANPRVGDLICKSGQTTGVVCGIEVIDIHASARYDGGVNHNLIFAEKPCDGLLGLRCPTVGQGGDSGGPVFKARSNRRAGIRGMEVAGSAPNNLYAEKARVIQRHLGVKVMRRR